VQMMINLDVCPSNVRIYIEGKGQGDDPIELDQPMRSLSWYGFRYECCLDLPVS
jgi:hypothetical protein